MSVKAASRRGSSGNSQNSAWR